MSLDVGCAEDAPDVAHSAANNLTFRKQIAGFYTAHLPDGRCVAKICKTDARLLKELREMSPHECHEWRVKVTDGFYGFDMFRVHPATSSLGTAKEMLVSALEES